MLASKQIVLPLFNPKRARELDDIDTQVREYLRPRFVAAQKGTDSWRVLGFCLLAQEDHSFRAAATYPRPDHPDPVKRLPLSFMLVAILVSLRTTLENEEKAMAEVIRRFPTEADLYQALEEELEECIGCAGMAATKSRRIRQALNYAETLEGGLEGLARLGRDEARATLLTIPGFGPKAADCMLSIGLGLGSMVIDVNVFRVGSSLLGMPWAKAPDYGNTRNVRELKVRLDRVVGTDAFLCQIVHTYLLLHGKVERIRGHSVETCDLGVFCRTCEVSDHTARALIGAPMSA